MLVNLSKYVSLILGTKEMCLYIFSVSFINHQHSTSNLFSRGQFMEYITSDITRFTRKKSSTHCLWPHGFCTTQWKQYDLVSKYVLCW